MIERIFWCKNYVCKEARNLITPSSASPSKSDSVQDIIMWLYHYNGDSMLTFHSVSDMCILLYRLPWKSKMCANVYSLTRVVMDMCKI